ncbi:serine/threonine protein kinase, partial [Planctomycetota bacterium]
MAELHTFLGKRRAVTSTVGPAQGVGLPDELVQKAVERLPLLALILAGGWLAAICTNLLRFLLAGEPPRITQPMLGTLGIALSVALSVVARRRLLPNRFLLDLSLVYVVLIAFLISMTENIAPRVVADSYLRSVSWVCVWIVLFPLMVPNSTRKTLVTALLAALTGPLALVLTEALLDNVVPSRAVYVDVFVPNLIIVMAVLLPARVIHNLGSEIRRAQRMGSYHLESVLGSGGMGQVWRARHHLLVRPAAVKLIRSESLGGGDGSCARTLVERFEREAQATALLCSPHTVVLYDFGVADDGTFYIAMELLDGLDLKALVERFGPLRPERVVFLLRQACHSL